MNRFYTYPLLFVMLASCTHRISYVGSSYDPTSRVDVFVDESAIKKTYDIVGKGIPVGSFFRRPEKIQEKAMAKARQKGADAILIKDYYIPNTGTGISTVMRTDSIGKGTVSIGNATIQQYGTPGTTILFLKYQ